MLRCTQQDLFCSLECSLQCRHWICLCWQYLQHVYDGTAGVVDFGTSFLLAYPFTKTPKDCVHVVNAVIMFLSVPLLFL